MMKEIRDNMISSPNEVEQTAISIANWINYNNRPFVLTADNGTKVYLTVLTEEQMAMLQAPMPDIKTVDLDKKESDM